MGESKRKITNDSQFGKTKNSLQTLVTYRDIYWSVESDLKSSEEEKWSFSVILLYNNSI